MRRSASRVEKCNQLVQAVALMRPGAVVWLRAPGLAIDRDSEAVVGGRFNKVRKQFTHFPLFLTNSMSASERSYRSSTKAFISFSFVRMSASTAVSWAWRSITCCTTAGLSPTAIFRRALASFRPSVFSVILKVAASTFHCARMNSPSAFAT